MHTRNTGMTLLELMITVAVVALLASIAYPSYQGQIRKSSRSEAKVALTSAAQALERCYTLSGTYVGCAALNPFIGKTPNAKYEITRAAAETQDTFSLLATAQGGQAQDKDCATFAMTNAGQSAKNAGGTDSPKCWR